MTYVHVYVYIYICMRRNLLESSGLRSQSRTLGFQAAQRRSYCVNLGPPSKYCLDTWNLKEMQHLKGLLTRLVLEVPTRPVGPNNLQRVIPNKCISREEHGNLETRNPRNISCFLGINGPPWLCSWHIPRVTHKSIAGIPVLRFPHTSLELKVIPGALHF